MSTARFFVDADLAAGEAVDLPPAVAHHASHVVRLRAGDPVVLFNGRGGEFSGRLAQGGRRAELAEHRAIERESPLAIHLVQAWVATDKLEWVIEKAVELGAASIALAPARRSVVHLDGARLAKRLARLRDIAVAACCQCGRNRIPPIEASADLTTALERSLHAPGTGAVLAPDATEKLARFATGRLVLTVAVGPEGGFDAEEVTSAVRAGYQPVAMGPRILRTETAGAAALALLQGIGGDFR